MALSVTSQLECLLTDYCGPQDLLHSLNRERLSSLLSSISGPELVSLLQQEYSSGWTPLHWAARRGQDDVISILLQSLSSADRIKLLTDTDYTPLHQAAYNGKTDSVRAILDMLTKKQQSQLISVENEDGKTAIQRASYKGHDETVHILNDYLYSATKGLYLERS